MMKARHGSLRLGRWWVLGVVLMATLLAAACGGDEPTATKAPRAATAAPAAAAATAAPGATTAPAAPAAAATTAPTRIPPTPTPTTPPLAGDVETFTWNFTWSSPGEAARLVSYDLADSLEAASGGRLKIRRHEAGSVVPGYNEIQGIQSGALDLATTWLGGYPAYLGVGAFFLGSSAGVLGTFGSGSWASQPEVWQAVTDLADGVKAFQSGISVAEHWALCHEGIIIQEPEDFRGLRYRAGGYYASVITALGGAGQDIAQTELFSALERGVLDCAEVGPASSNYTRFFYEIAPEFMVPGQHQQGYAGFGVVLSEDSWNEMPEDLQLALTSAFNAYAWTNMGNNLRENMEAWEILTDPADPLIRVHRLPKHTQQWIRDTSWRFFNDEVKGSEVAITLWESQKSYDKIYFDYWDQTAKVAYESTYPISSKPVTP